MKVCSFQIGIDMFYYMHVGRMISDLRTRNFTADIARFVFILILTQKLRVQYLISEFESLEMLLIKRSFHSDLGILMSVYFTFLHIMQSRKVRKQGTKLVTKMIHTFVSKLGKGGCRANSATYLLPHWNLSCRL